jgi:hypothetical protein
MSLALAIERLAIGCHVPRSVADDTRRAKDVVDRVLSSATRELPDYLHRALASEPASDAIAFIDTLHFDVTINTEAPRGEIARALAAQLLRVLWRTLDDPGTIRFEDRAEMLARFVIDVAQGAAFTQTWHRCFAGLRLLSPSGILRTLMVDEPLVAATALARLLPADLQRVTAVLTEPDAERALAAVLSAAQAGGEADPLAVATAIVSQRCLPLQKPRQRFAFVIAMLRETGAAGDVSLALGLVQLASEPDAAALTDTEAAERLNAIIAKRTPSAERNAASVAEAVRILSCELPGDQASEQSRCCGGIWLILPHILAILGSGPTLAPVALCALAFAAGEDAINVWRDDLLRATLDLNDALLSDFQEQPGAVLTFLAERLPRDEDEPAGPHSPPPYWLRRRNLAHLRRGATQLNLPRPLTRAATRVAYAALTAYARRLPGFAESSFAHLWKNLLATPATLRLHADLIEVALTPPPLDVIWRISGADRAAYVLPNGRRVRVGPRR